MMTMREQLQVLVDDWKRRSKFVADENWLYGEGLSTAADELEAILATPEPAVTVRKGWVCKGRSALKFCQVYPTWYTDDGNWGTDQACDEFYADGIITDPWEESHPNGGPECIMGVK